MDVSLWPLMVIYGIAGLGLLFIAVILFGLLFRIFQYFVLPNFNKPSSSSQNRQRSNDKSQG